MKFEFSLNCVRSGECKNIFSSWVSKVGFVKNSIGTIIIKKYYSIQSCVKAHPVCFCEWIGRMTNNILKLCHLDLFRSSF